MKNIMDAKIVAGSYVAKLNTSINGQGLWYSVYLYGWEIGSIHSEHHSIDVDNDRDLEALIKACNKEFAKVSNHTLYTT